MELRLRRLGSMVTAESVILLPAEKVMSGQKNSYAWSHSKAVVFRASRRR